MPFNPANIKALCHRETDPRKLEQFDKLLNAVSYHRACDDNSEIHFAREKMEKALQFVVDNEWGYDHIHYFFEQGGGSYLVTRDEFYRYLIRKYYNLLKERTPQQEFKGRETN